MIEFNWLAHRKGFRGWWREDGHVKGSQGGPINDEVKKKRIPKNNEAVVTEFKEAVSKIKKYDEGDKHLFDDIDLSIADAAARELMIDPDMADKLLKGLPEDMRDSVRKEYEYIKKRTPDKYYNAGKGYRLEREEVGKKYDFEERKNNNDGYKPKHLQKESNNSNTESDKESNNSNTESDKESNNTTSQKKITSSQLHAASNEFRIASKGMNDISSGFDKAYTHLHTAKNEKEDRSKKVESLSNEELKRVIERIKLNEEYNRVTSKKKSDGYHKTMAALAVLGSAATVTATGLSIAAGIKQLRNK